MNYAIFNLAGTFFYAITDKDYPAEEQLMTDDQMLFAIEPSFNIHKKYTLGVSYEYHDPDREVHKDDFQFLGMNHYIYPTMNTEIVVWYGYNFTDTDNTPFGKARFSLGLSGKASF